MINIDNEIAKLFTDLKIHIKKISRYGEVKITFYHQTIGNNIGVYFPNSGIFYLTNKYALYNMDYIRNYIHKQLLPYNKVKRVEFSKYF